MIEYHVNFSITIYRPTLVNQAAEKNIPGQHRVESAMFDDIKIFCRSIFRRQRSHRNGMQPRVAFRSFGGCERRLDVVTYTIPFLNVQTKQDGGSNETRSSTTDWRKV